MKYAALLRGINVGGKNIVKMAALRGMLAELGFTGIQTYIQSGNAIFDAEEEPDAIKEKMGAAFQAAFGFACAIILRTESELSAIINHLPFSREDIDAAIAANADVEHLYVYFLDSAPEPEMLKALSAGYTGPDRLFAGVREIYLLCHQSVRDSKLGAALAKTKIPMTARNWKTLLKLHGMMEE